MITTRIGDMAFGICYYPPPPFGPGPTPSVGIVSSGDPNNLSGGLPTSALGDIVIFPCGVGIIVSGITNSLTSGVPTSSLGSSVVGPIFQGNIVSGDTNNLNF